MTLRRQLLLVSLLTLMLPWAGCEFIRETESALRTSQQTMLSGLARAVADSLAAYPEAFPAEARKSPTSRSSKPWGAKRFRTVTARRAASPDLQGVS